MNILGVHGWYERAHDAAACVLQDGHLVAAAEEERFVRSKHAYDRVPHNAIAYCLTAAGISADEIDYIALGWDYPFHYGMRFRDVNMQPGDLVELFVPSKLFARRHVPEFAFVRHHLAHAASSYRLSGFAHAAIVVIDGQGEDVSVSLGIGRGNAIEIVRTWPIDQSLGYFFGAVTRHVGFRTDQAGKTMGLAAYGSPTVAIDALHVDRDGYRMDLPGTVHFGPSSFDEEEQILALWDGRLPGAARRSPRRLSDPPDARDADLAASAQAALTGAVHQLSRVALEEAGARDLCLAGGVALNCLANGSILREGLAERLFVPPMANDAGAAIGAAYQLYADLGFSSLAQLHSAAWGPAFADEHIEACLRRAGVRYSRTEHIARDVANLLDVGKIVGWFHGRMEIGPRALGQRSILADPRKSAIRDRVNQIKGREHWRPLAPSILRSRCGEYFAEDHGSPFMLTSVTVLPEARATVPGIVHADGSTRPHLVYPERQPLFAELLSEFNQLTGVPMLLNTSFNIGAEPIVCSPEDAVHTFVGSRLDVLSIGSFLLSR